MLKRHGLKKGLSLVLVFCLILSLMPTVAMAQEPTAAAGTETTVDVTDGETPAGTETGDTTGTETGDTTGTETGDTTGTETGDTTGTENETEKDDPLDDFLDDILTPLPGDTGSESGDGNETTQPDDGETPNIPTEDVNGEKPEAPEGTVTPDPNPQDPSTAPSDDFPTILPVFPSEEDPAEVLPPEELLPEVPEDTTVDAQVATEAGDQITISVTGPGLTDLIVEAIPSITTLPVEPAQEQVDYVAYDVTPMVGDVPYTESADVTIPVPADWDEDAEIYGFVVNGEDAEEPVTVIEGVRNEEGTFTFTAPHFSIMGLYAEPQLLELTQKSVKVSVDQKTTIPVPDVDLSNSMDDSGLNEAIATVDVEYQEIPEGIAASKVNSLVSGQSYYISDGNGNYLTLSGNELTNATKLEEATQWTYDRNGYLSAEGYYLTYTTDWGRPNGLDVSSRSGTKWTYDGNRIYYDRYITEYPITYNDGWTLDSGTSAGAYKQVPTEESKATLITITGVSEGTTSVIVGDTQYNITVEEQAPAGALTGDSLTVEYWITNSTVHESTQYSPSSKTISASEASGSEGVEIAGEVPALAYSYYDGKVDVHFWQAMRLDAQNHQTGDGGDDETADGTVFTRVRYYKNAWQYYADGKWHWFLSGDQAVAYYMQYTDVTAEITTAMKDWGYDPSEGETPNSNSGAGQVALSVAVVYPDGNLSPAEDAIYPQSTTVFNYWHNRNIGLIAPLNNSDYEVTKITVTSGKRDGYDRATWGPSDSITWEKARTEGGTWWFDETVYWDESDGGVPMVSGTADNIVWEDRGTAKLVLIYLKPIKKESNLNVVWYDDSSKNEILASQIVVSGETEKTFVNSLENNTDLPVAGEYFDLDDEAYVTNSSGVPQKFNKDLTIMQDIAAQYRSGLYEYIGAELSEDGKTLTLHYQIDSSKVAHQYVVDFGLPVNVPLRDLVEDVSTVQSVAVTDTMLAKVETDNSITFQPNKVMDAVMVLTVTLTFNGGSTQNIQIGFVPASTMYYEEGFMDLNGFNGGSKGETRQGTSKLGAGTVYGYDAAYANETGPSNNSEATSNTAGSTATFSFKGTGVDIYANCSSDTGVVMIKVYDDDSKLIKLLTVDTAMVDGVTEATKGQAVPAYNIPIASIDGLDYGTYDVEIVHVARKAGETSTDPVYLDGFRVHQPLGISEGNKYYGDDTEAGAEISELRDAALHIVLPGVDSSKSEYAKQLANAKAQVYAKTGGQGASAVVLSYAEGDEEKVVIDILDNGPKNELYLAPGETLVFKVDSVSGKNVQVGLKQLTAGASCTINESPVAVNSSTDMFYPVTPTSDGYVTIQNTGTGILAVTELKVAGK